MIFFMTRLKRQLLNSLTERGHLTANQEGIFTGSTIQRESLTYSFYAYLFSNPPTTCTRLLWSCISCHYTVEMFSHEPIDFSWAMILLAVASKVHEIQATAFSTKHKNNARKRKKRMKSFAVVAALFLSVAFSFWRSLNVNEHSSYLPL